MKVTVKKCILKLVIDMFKRKIMNEIKKWENSLKIKKRALILRGLRQIGKTTVVKEYCQSKYENVVYINFMDLESIKNIFDKDLIVDDIIRDLSAALPGNKFIPNKTVIIFDEIQECKEIVTIIKFLVENGKYKYVLSGSLLGVELRDLRSAPVGYMRRGYNKKKGKGIPTGFEYPIQMYSMDFEEYLWARGIDDKLIDYIKDCYKKKEKVSETVNNSFMKYYKEYLCVGGLPDAVNTFLLTKDLNQVYDIQIGILENYKDDFVKHLDEEEEKYVDKNELTKIMEVYNSIPSQLAKENKKFQYSKIDKKAKGREYRFAITWLEEFGLAKLCYNLNNIELPLEGNKNEECFKLYITDTGLFMAMLGNDTYNEILNKDMGIYKGAIYENIIAESFIKNGKNLYYFSKPSGLEIDFITKIKNEIVAVEVKSTNGNTKSLNELLKNDKYNVSNAIKLINGNIGQNNNIYTIPLYMSFLIGGQE